MRKILFIIIYLSFSLVLKSQCVSIEFSIEWAKDTLYPSYGIDSDCRPYLRVNYRNNSESDIYFLNMASENYGFPDVRMIPLINPHPIFGESLDKFSDYTNEDLHVYLDISPEYPTLWMIIDENDTTMSSLINYYIYDIHCFFEKRLGREDDRIKPYNSFSEDDLTPKGILTENLVNDRFIFLKANASKEYIYNLIAFEIVGGNYTFKLHGSIPDYGIVEYNFTSRNKTPLPKKIGDYNLYSGAVKANEVRVKFIGQKYNKKISE